MLTSTELCRLLKMPRMTLQQWITNEAVIPKQPRGKGRGAPLLFSPVQLVGIAYAVTVRDAGSKRDWAVKAARFVASHTADQLRRAFSDGRVIPLVSPTLGEGRLSRSENLDTPYNLETVHAEVLQSLREAASRANEAGKPDTALRLNAAVAELTGISAARRPVGEPA
jgi:hypothetical protein